MCIFALPIQWIHVIGKNIHKTVVILQIMNYKHWIYFEWKVLYFSINSMECLEIHLINSVNYFQIKKHLRY